MNVMTKTTFTIYGAAVLSTIVIGEYKNKTMSVMFLYPINRKKIITAKLIVVAMFVAVSTFVSDIVISAIFCLDATYFSHFISQQLTSTMIIRALNIFAVSAVSSSGICLMSLFFGMLKKSVSATIVSSVIIMSILGSNGNGVSLCSFVSVQIILGLIGVAVACFTVRNIENVDLGN